MDKEKVYENIYTMLNEGFFFDKYTELTEKISLLEYERNKEIAQYLENTSANLFNAILIGCQLLDNKNKIIKFVDMFSTNLESYSLEMFLKDFGITKDEALNRLKHGFGVHFTTTKICDEIIKNGFLAGYGKNAMFTKEEDRIINDASIEQQENDPDALETMNYLFKGFGAGVSSYGSMTNGFWMYHTPESLSFLFGNISSRNKEAAMRNVASKISSLSEENKKIVFNVMSNIYDRLIGEEQEIGCILIDRDALEYEVDYYYHTGDPVAVERRPYSKNLEDLMLNDNKISNDIDVKNLKFLTLPTIYELEIKKQEKLRNQYR